jgi:hypothetical protein
MSKPWALALWSLAKGTVMRFNDETAILDISYVFIYQICWLNFLSRSS